jgi:hypothetical protein
VVTTDRALLWVEAALIVGVLARLLTTLPRELRLAQRWGWCVLLFGAGLFARCLVPWVPANFYSDLATPYPSFVFSHTYAHPFYDALWFLQLGPMTPWFANVVLGAFVAPLLYLSLTARDPANQSEPPSHRAPESA